VILQFGIDLGAILLAVDFCLEIQATIFPGFAAVRERYGVDLFSKDFCYGSAKFVLAGADDFVTPLTWVDQSEFFAGKIETHGIPFPV
jgi:hypothetical protein